MGKDKGKASYEVIFAMLLLILFSVATLTLVSSGTDAYITTEARSNSNSEMRIASSYIYTKTRQNMERGSIYIDSSYKVDGNCLVISQVIEGSLYETIIFVHEGMLRETLIQVGTEFDPDSSFEIAKIDKLELTESEKGLSFTLISNTSEGRNSVDGFISTL
jgi:hypothetical protein